MIGTHDEDGVVLAFHVVEFQGFFLPFFPDLKFVPIFRSSNFLCFSEKKYESIFRSNYCYEFHVLSASIFGADFSVWPKNWPKKWPYTHFFKSKYMSAEIPQKNLDLKNGWFFRSRFMSAMSQFPFIMRFSCALTHPPKMCATFSVFILKHTKTSPVAQRRSLSSWFGRYIFVCKAVCTFVVFRNPIPSDYASFRS